MAGRVGPLRDQFVRESIRLVLSLAFLVLNNAALKIESLLVDCPKQMPHSIGLEPESVVQSRSRHVLEVVCPIGIGRAVQVGRSDWLQSLNIPALVVFAPSKHQVLEQV